MYRKDKQQQPMFYARKLEDSDVLLAFQTLEEWLSRKQIAERVWRKVTPDFRARLERLVGEGKLTRTVKDLPNGRKMFWYKKTGVAA